MGKNQKDHDVKYFQREEHVVNIAIYDKFVLAFHRLDEEIAKVGAMVMSKIMAAMKTCFPSFHKDDFEGVSDKTLVFFINRIYPQTDPSNKEDFDHCLVHGHYLSTAAA